MRFPRPRPLPKPEAERTLAPKKVRAKPRPKPAPRSTPLTVADFEAWFARRGWTVFDFQRAAWDGYARGASGLVHAPTGTGKTLAAWLGALLAAQSADEPLRVMWITPMRALAADTAASLQRSADELGAPWTVEVRTGDTGAATRARQRKRLPQALVTTPESASLLLSYADLVPQFEGLHAIVVDEWHELLGTKRGVQTELVISRLRTLAPGLRVWGLSATLGNLETARDALLGTDARDGLLLGGDLPKHLAIDTLLPDSVERFPWSGHMGLPLLPRVAEAIDAAHSTLVFTNTRSQAERWFEHLQMIRPGLGIALHHGSMDAALRAAAEDGLRDGSLRAVVATSSLDLGVDFTPVDQVIQIGGPKGVARLLQRAGRSGHRPGATSRVLCVPTHALELAEFAAARVALAQGRIESRVPLTNSLDVLAQHVVTLALSARLTADAIRREVTATHAYAALADIDWQWVLDFVMRGGALHAYPQYRKVLRRESDGVLWVEDAAIARRHRMSIGTISADSMMRVQYQNGPTLGSVEESFIARMRPGDSFLFAGRKLTLKRVRDMTAVVSAGGKGQTLPRWAGGKMPLSSTLAATLVELLGSRADGHPSPGPLPQGEGSQDVPARGLSKTANARTVSRDTLRPSAHSSPPLAGGGGGRGRAPDSTATPELDALAPLLDIQARWSHLPAPGRLVVERATSREGEHLFVFPFAGRHVHEGLSALLAYRLSKLAPITATLTPNDYGFELLTTKLPPLDAAQLKALLSPADLDLDLPGSLNAAELAKRRFREIARVAGLVFEGWPGAGKSVKQVQVSSGLIYDVLAKYDQDNRLTRQALAEVLEHQLDYRRLREALERIAACELLLVDTPRLTPFAFPLWSDRIGNRLSTEDWRARVERMAATLETAAD